MKIQISFCSKVSCPSDNNMLKYIIEIFCSIMRLTPDSRPPAKADPSARAGVGVVVVAGVVVVVVVVGVVVVAAVAVAVVVDRCWPYLGAGLPLSWPEVVVVVVVVVVVMSTQVAHILADVGPIVAYVVPILALCRPM